MKEPIDATTHRNLLDDRDAWRRVAERLEADNAALRRFYNDFWDNAEPDQEGYLFIASNEIEVADEEIKAIDAALLAGKKK